MPSGGVTTDEANLKAWLAAGVHCVGMGSHLVDAAKLAAGRFDNDSLVLIEKSQG